MGKWEVSKQIAENGIIAVIRNSQPDKIVGLAQALLEGGISALEITAESPGALASIALLKERFQNDVLVGVGTVLDANKAIMAIEAGASFVVSPVCNAEIIRATNRYNKVSICGAMSPTEILSAYEAGADFVKVFPASAVGSQYIKDIQGPLGHIPLIPTGGINLDNIGQFISNGSTAVGVGGSLLSSMKSMNEITNEAKLYVEAINKARG